MMCMMLMGFGMTETQAQIISPLTCGCTLTADPVTCTIELCCDSRFTFSGFPVKDCETYYDTSTPVYTGCISFPIIDQSNFKIWVWNYSVNTCITGFEQACQLEIQIPSSCP